MDAGPLLLFASTKLKRAKIIHEIDIPKNELGNFHHSLQIYTRETTAIFLFDVKSVLRILQLVQDKNDVNYRNAKEDLLCLRAHPTTPFILNFFY